MKPRKLSVLIEMVSNQPMIEIKNDLREYVNNAVGECTQITAQVIQPVDSVRRSSTRAK